MPDNSSFDSRPEVEIKLHFPIMVDGTTYDRFTMRPPRVKDGLDADRQKGTDSERLLFVMARLCGTSTDVIRELYEIDATQILEQRSAFLGRTSA